MEPAPLPQPPAGLERKAVLAASAPWLGALLNLVPGLGTGYIYQRRWRPYWITASLSVLWIGLGAATDAGTDPAQEPLRGLIGLGGLLLLAAITGAEAFLAGRRARMD